MTHPVATTVIKNPSWWRRRTQLERVLTLVTVFTAGLCAVLVAALALTSYRQVHPSAGVPPVVVLAGLPPPQYVASHAGGRMRASLDPAERLPAEVLEAVWACLPPPDLLACRLVSPAWRDLLEESPVWGRHLSPPPTASRAWTAFLRSRELAAAWARPSFSLQSLPYSGLAYHKIAVGDKHVYILEGHKVQKYDKRLERVEEWELEAEGVCLAAGGETVGAVWRGRACEYWLEVRGAVKLRAAVASGLLAICAGGKAVLYHPRPGKLAIRGSSGREEQLSAPPGELAGLALSGRYAAALSVHPVRDGAGFSVHLLRRGSRGPWVEVHRAENRSPLALLSGALTSTPGALVLTRRESSERAESTLQVALLDDGRELRVPDAAALLPRDSGSVVAVSADGAMHYSTRGRQRWALRLGRTLLGARLGPDFLLLWDGQALQTLTLEDGEVSQLKLEWTDWPS